MHTGLVSKLHNFGLALRLDYEQYVAAVRRTIELQWALAMGGVVCYESNKQDVVEGEDEPPVAGKICFCSETEDEKESRVAEAYDNPDPQYKHIQ